MKTWIKRKHIPFRRSFHGVSVVCRITGTIEIVLKKEAWGKAQESLHKNPRFSFVKEGGRHLLTFSGRAIESERVFRDCTAEAESDGVLNLIVADENEVMRSFVNAMPEGTCKAREHQGNITGAFARIRPEKAVA